MLIDIIQFVVVVAAVKYYLKEINIRNCETFYWLIK